jgi:hypothetical protein
MPFTICPFRRLPLTYWVLIDENHRGMKTYVDPETIRRKGDLAKIWQMFDEKIVDTIRGSSFCLLVSSRI